MQVGCFQIHVSTKEVTGCFQTYVGTKEITNQDSYVQHQDSYVQKKFYQFLDVST